MFRSADRSLLMERLSLVSASFEEVWDDWEWKIRWIMVGRSVCDCVDKEHEDDGKSPRVQVENAWCHGCHVALSRHTQLECVSGRVNYIVFPLLIMMT